MSAVLKKTGRPRNDVDEFDWLLLPSSKVEAKRLGALYYFTGRPCIKGHVSKRETSSGCYECKRERENRRYRDDEVFQAKRKGYYSLPDVVQRRVSRKIPQPPPCEIEVEARKTASASRKAKRIKADLAEKSRRYAADPDYRAQILARNSAWHANNTSKANARIARRRARKINATPPWLTRNMIVAMDAIYTEATRLSEETGVPHEVDHIIPLLAENVCGLHVPWNLQIVTRTENRQKQNKVPEGATGMAFLRIADLGNALG